jgi:hypothetical protein
LHAKRLQLARLATRSHTSASAGFVCSGVVRTLTGEKEPSDAAAVAQAVGGTGEETHASRDRFEVTVHTGQLQGMGTDARVSIELFGDKVAPNDRMRQTATQTR